MGVLKMYINRTIEQTIKKAAKGFKVVLITGPRQVGKSTTLQYLFKDKYNYVTLDDINQLNIALEDPKLFFLNNPLPIIIDEVQYAPNLFREIKRIVDESDLRGQVILSGSQAFHLMDGVTESLAGRVAILEMSRFSLREYHNDTYYLPFIPNKDYFLENRIVEKDFDIWEIIHRGSLPMLYTNEYLDWHIYYSSYVKTYIERDVRNIINIRDLNNFSNFLISLAARTGSLLNYNQVANEINIDINTVKSWTKVLEATGIIILVRPFKNNALKRMVKTPMVYFLDTGLVSYLLKWNTKDTLRNGAMSGHILESFAVSEIVKSFKNAGYLDVPITFYRDYNQKEIDLIIEANGILYPIEIKKTTNPTKNMAKNFNALENIPGFRVGEKIILSLVDRTYQLSDGLYAFPIKNI